MKSLDLFSGAGGLTLGFRNAGIHSIGAIELDRFAAETFHYNFPEIPLFNRDIYSFSDEEICGIFSFRAVRRKAVAIKFYVGFLIKSDLCRKRHRHLTEDAGAFLLECSGNQLNNSSSFCWSVPSLAYGSASNCRKLCLMSFVSSLKPRMYESAM